MGLKIKMFIRFVFTAKVDEYMKAAVAVERFSGSILIARDGKPIVSKGYGMANVEFGAPNKPNTVFRLASLPVPINETDDEFNWGVWAEVDRPTFSIS